MKKEVDQFYLMEVTVSQGWHFSLDLYGQIPPSKHSRAKHVMQSLNAKASLCIFWKDSDWVCWSLRGLCNKRCELSADCKDSTLYVIKKHRKYHCMRSVRSLSRGVSWTEHLFFGKEQMIGYNVKDRLQGTADLEEDYCSNSDDSQER